MINSFHSLFDTNTTENNFMQLIDRYIKDLNSVVIGEFKLWLQKLNNLNITQIMLLTH